MIGIYKITNPKGKVYIGKSIDIDKRLAYYKHYSHRKTQHKLNNSISKYGFENHMLEIIENCDEPKLNEREIFWINYYNSVESGLNIMYGGEGGRQSQEVKDKKSISMTGKKHSLSTRKKMSESKKGHSMFNNDWRKAISEANKGGTSSKPVLQYDKQGNFIKEWSSKIEAAKTLNINKVSITNNTSGLTKSAGGYIWKNK
jgi:group I intron endonuclease